MITKYQPDALAREVLMRGGVPSLALRVSVVARISRSGPETSSRLFLLRFPTPTHRPQRLPSDSELSKTARNVPSNSLRHVE
jgi:hypothetical protein